MRKKVTCLLTFLMILLLFSSCKKEDIIEIGRKHAGGIIFYIDDTGEHGLVCTESDQSTNAHFYNGTFTYVSGTNSAIGSGQANTDALCSAFGEGYYAAKICQDLVLDDYSDWFLPSFKELELILTNISQAGLGGFVNGTYYWCSSLPSGGGGAYMLSFKTHPGGYGVSYGQNETAVGRVRAVRAF